MSFSLDRPGSAEAATKADGDTEGYAPLKARAGNLRSTPRKQAMIGLPMTYGGIIYSTKVGFLPFIPDHKKGLLEPK